MKVWPGPRIDVDSLRDLAGEKVFARGQAYQRGGKVEMLAVEPGRVLARVLGTQDYRIELTARDKGMRGKCSCPALGDSGVCKHIVAVALAANALAGDAGAEDAGALARMRDHLKQQGVDPLVDMILGQADRDPALFRKLDMAAAAVRADDKTLLARLRKAIDQATRTSGYVNYRGAADWAADVNAALDTVAHLVAAGRGAVALELVERAVDRIEEAIDAIDDSDGHCGALLQRCRDIHLAAARAAGPEPVRLARDLFARETEGEYDTFDGAVARYADVLGDAGLAEYRRLAAAAWAKLPPQSAAAGGGHAGDYRGLAGILDFFAERAGDVDARIALRSKDLSSPWAYLQLAEFCLAQGRQDEALRRAEEGLWMFEDGRQDERLVVFAAGLLSKAKRRDEAEALLQRAFEKAPSLELYVELRKFGPRGRDRAVAFVQTQLTQEAPNPRQRPADLLIRVLMHERAFEQAWAAVHRHGASVGVREALARASEATHPGEAVAVYAERVEALVEGGGNSAYAQAAALIGRMAVLRSSAEQAAYVAALKLRFGRKRNFMKLLG